MSKGARWICNKTNAGVVQALKNPMRNVSPRGAQTPESWRISTSTTFRRAQRSQLVSPPIGHSVLQRSSLQGYTQHIYVLSAKVRIAPHIAAHLPRTSVVQTNTLNQLLPCALIDTPQSYLSPRREQDSTLSFSRLGPCFQIQIPNADRNLCDHFVPGVPMGDLLSETLTLPA